MIDVHFHFPDLLHPRSARLQAVPRAGEAVRVARDTDPAAGLPRSSLYRVERVEWRMVEHELQPVQVFLSAPSPEKPSPSRETLRNGMIAMVLGLLLPVIVLFVLLLTGGARC